MVANMATPMAVPKWGSCPTAIGIGKPSLLCKAMPHIMMSGTATTVVGRPSTGIAQKATAVA